MSNKDWQDDSKLLFDWMNDKFVITLRMATDEIPRWTDNDDEYDKMHLFSITRVVASGQTNRQMLQVILLRFNLLIGWIRE